MIFSQRVRRSVVPLVAMLVLLLAGAVEAGLTISFDYTYDASGFFSDPARREALQRSAAQWNRFLDELDAIAPSLLNHWSYKIPRPDHPDYAEIVDDTVPKDTIKVYVGGRPMDNAALALGGSAILWTIAGPPQWRDTIERRGQSGAGQSPPTDFAPAAGSIAFNTSQSWHFGADASGLDQSQIDFFTVAAHELGHVLGVGPAESWQAKIAEGKFTGAQAVAVGSSGNPRLQLDATGGHWAAGTTGQVGSAAQTALLQPNIAFGQRLWPTTLDRAALRDIGWQEAMPGDVDRDRDVDVPDIEALLKANAFGAGPIGASWLEGDFDGDQQVAASDIQMLLRANLFNKGPYTPAGSTLAGTEMVGLAALDPPYAFNPAYQAAAPYPSADSPSAYPTTVVVPEPGALVLLLSGLLALWCLTRLRVRG